MAKTYPSRFGESARKCTKQHNGIRHELPFTLTWDVPSLMRDFCFRSISSTNEGTEELARPLPSGDNKLWESLPCRVF